MPRVIGSVCCCCCCFGNEFFSKVFMLKRICCNSCFKSRHSFSACCRSYNKKKIIIIFLLFLYISLYFNTVIQPNFCLFNLRIHIWFIFLKEKNINIIIDIIVIYQCCLSSFFKCSCFFLFRKIFLFPYISF